MTEEQRKTAFRLGFCAGLADAGVTPGEFVVAARLRKEASVGSGVVDSLGLLGRAILKLPILTMMVGGLGGSLLAQGVHSLTVPGPEDLNAVRTREKLQTLAELTRRARVNTAMRRAKQKRKVKPRATGSSFGAPSLDVLG